MSTTLLHLSDLHLVGNDFPAHDRAMAVARAVQSHSRSPKAILLLVTGDIAFSGQTVQYQFAESFFSSLREAMTQLFPHCTYRELFVPGNHDCNFEANSSTRSLVISSLCQDTEHSIPIDDSILDTCLRPQKEFFEFVSQRGAAQLPCNARQKLSNSVLVEVDGRRIIVHLFNTAWISTLPSQQGDMFLPISLLPTAEDNAHLSIGVLHHNFNWLEATNARAAKNLIEQVCDFVLTGHEHHADGFNKQLLDGNVIVYREGGIFHGADTACSSFNVIRIDFEERTYTASTFSMDNNLYRPSIEGNPLPLPQTGTSKLARLEPSPSFQAWLDDPGTAFTHPRKDNLVLDDLYVYPDLNNLQYESVKETEPAPPIIHSATVADYLMKREALLVLGAERAGKTSLCKVLHSVLRKNGLVPLLLNGADIRSVHLSKIDEYMNGPFSRQFNSASYERFRQLEPSQKAVIIDDFDVCRLNVDGQNALVTELKVRFGRIYIVADSVFQLQEFTEDHKQRSELLTFSHCLIRDFGHALRARLIRRWFLLGQEKEISGDELERKVTAIERTVDTLLGKNLLPAYPIFVLSILQTYEAGANLSTASGSYGFYYEVLIYDALSNASRLLPMDILQTMLSYIAYAMYEDKVALLSDEEMARAIQRYKATYSMNFSADKVLGSLVESLVLRKEVGGYSFRYRYGYYYFAAKYIAMKLHSRELDAQLRERINSMIGKIHAEDNANVLIFLIYLTKDNQVIEDLMSHARSLYSEYPACDLDSDTGFAAMLLESTPKLNLKGGAPQDHLEQARIERDELERELPDRESAEAGVAEGEAQLGELLRLNTAMKTLQILGQVLRNFPGSLEGELKTRIASESYELGLRTLKAMLSIIESRLPELREIFSAMLRETKGVIEEKEIEQRTDTLLFFLTTYFAYGVVKRISYSVGSEHLKETYLQVEAERPSIAIRIISSSIKMDHFGSFPDKEVISLYSDIYRSMFPSTLLRMMVRDHFYLYPVDRSVRQSVCAKLGIVAEDPKMLSGRDKKY